MKLEQVGEAKNLYLIMTIRAADRRPFCKAYFLARRAAALMRVSQSVWCERTNTIVRWRVCESCVVGDPQQGVLFLIDMANGNKVLRQNNEPSVGERVNTMAASGKAHSGKVAFCHHLHRPANDNLPRQCVGTRLIHRSILDTMLQDPLGQGAAVTWLSKQRPTGPVIGDWTWWDGGTFLLA